MNILNDFVVDGVSISEGRLVHHLKKVLFAARVVLICSPVGVELVANLAIFLLLVCLSHERVLEEVWPGETLAWGFVEQTLEEGLELGTHVVWELDGVFDDEVNQRVDRIRVKWRCSNKEFINDDSKGPQVYSVVVWQLLNQFWCHVQGRSLNRGQHDRIGTHGAGEAKIAKLDDTVGRYQNVLRFHVTVNDAVRVQIVQRVYQLLSNFANFRLAKVPVVFKDLEEFTLGKLSNHAKLVRSFERVEQ